MKRLLTIAILAVLLPTVANAAIVTISSNSAFSITQGSAGSDSAQFTGTAIPTSQLLGVTLGEFHTRTQIDYFTSGGATIFGHSFDHKRSGGARSGLSQSKEDGLVFSVNADTPYQLSGNYTVTDVGAGGLVHFDAWLRDVPTDVLLARSTQQSQSSANESFTLGGTDADALNRTLGSLSGTLFAGQIYEWGNNVVIQNINNAPDGGASAVGNMTLTIGNASVPEPRSLLIWFLLLGVCGIVVLRQRRNA